MDTLLLFNNMDSEGPCLNQEDKEIALIWSMSRMAWKMTNMSVYWDTGNVARQHI